MGYYDNVNEDLLRMIPPDAARVCEVGCGAGAMAARYKRINPDCLYYGLELDFKAFRVASDSGVFESVLNSDAEKTWAYELDMLEPDLDVLIYGDVLEHLRDPWKHLSHAVAEWVRPGGQVIACLPNVQNFGMIAGLILGEWDYTDAGLMDRTHLRWFTRSSAIDLFEKAGLSVTSIEPRLWSDDWNAPHQAFMRSAELFVRDYGLDRKEFSRNTRAFQWVIRGVKGEPPARKILIRSVSTNHCCRRPRLTEPGVFLSTIPGVRYVESETEVRDGEAPIVILQRDAWKPDHVRRLVHSGVLVIGEWDDWPGHFPANTTTDYLPIRGVHAVMTTTNTMAATLDDYNPNVGVFDNQLADFPPENDPDRPARIFCGWQNRTDDWRPIIDGFNAVLEDHPEVGVDIIGDREFYHALQTDNKKFWMFQPYEKYLKILRDCTVAVLPLIDNDLSRHKSDIKFIECAANGVAVLAPIGSVYTEAILGYTMRGTLYFDAEFEDVLRTCIESDHCKAYVIAARQYVRTHRLLRYHYRERYRWFNALLDTKDELTEQLYERCPELRP